MATVNMGSILNKVKAWENSDAGQKRMKATIDKYIQTGVKTTQAGDSVLTLGRMKEMADILIRILAKSAAGLPSSVADHFSSLKSTPPKRLADGSYQIEISFADDLTRASLQPYDYGGAKNIIAIFNNGYPQSAGRSEAISQVSGFWHGEYVHARGSREGLHFMQAAANEFNSTYGAVYDVYVTLDPVYEE